jgi:sulfur-oxidizing protein SoxX
MPLSHFHIRARVLVARVGLAIGLATLPAAWAESLPRPPGVAPGDPDRGLCLLCHSAPVGDARQQGNLAPPLAGVGTRLDEAELRLRIHDSRRVNPESLMPAYGVVDAAPRVAQAWRGKTIFSAQQIEDVVAWLVTLK